MCIDREISDLVKLLNKASDVYYNTDKNLMSDAEYDKAYDRLLALEKESGVQLTNSPTRSVGFEVKSSLSKVEHLIPLKSLDKLNNDIVGLQGWMGEEECYETLKLDGLTTELDYVDGYLVQGSTRGNGLIGEDITHNVKYFKNVPLRLSEPLTIKVVGESIIKYGSFNHINSKLSEDDKYKTPRNLVAGTVRSLKSESVAQRDVRFFAFDCIDSNLGCATQKDRMDYLEELGFDIAIGLVVNSDTVEYVTNTLKEKARLEGYPIDGLVCTFNNLDKRDSMGSTSKYPKHSIAYKFRDDVEETVLEEIEWSIGKSGALTPVAIFKSVELDGTDVSRASVHNISVLKGLLLGLGDSITVKKANQIIPQIEENLTKSDSIVLPTHCPYCGNETIVVEDNESAILKCTNDVLSCKGQLVEMLAHYVSREALNVVGLSDKNLKKFVDGDVIKDKADIHKIVNDDTKQANIMALGGITAKGLDKLCGSISKASKDVKMENFLVSLAIDGVGRSLSKDLSKKFKTVEALMVTTEEDLISMDGVSTITAKKIVDYFSGNIEMLKELLSYIAFEEVVEVAVGDRFTGLTFVVTGAVAKFKNRNELGAYIESNGGKLAKSVSKNTDYLMCNEGLGSSKGKKAIELGVKVINEDELLSLNM